MQVFWVSLAVSFGVLPDGACVIKSCSYKCENFFLMPPAFSSLQAQLIAYDRPHICCIHRRQFCLHSVCGCSNVQFRTLRPLAHFSQSPNVILLHKRALLVWLLSILRNVRSSLGENSFACLLYVVKFLFRQS